jgi:hypothetical protein
MYISANRDRRLPNFVLNADETLAALGLSRVNTATLIWHDPASTEVGVRLLLIISLL